MNKLITIYTDGSSIGNPGPGGYGIVMLVDGEDYKKEFSQGFKFTTNNRMELLAVIVALETIKIKNSNVSIFTDSKYVADAELFALLLLPNLVVELIDVRLLFIVNFSIRLLLQESVHNSWLLLGLN